MKILFDAQNTPIPQADISTCVQNFGNGYRQTVQEVIFRTHAGLSQNIFTVNVAQLMHNFKMTRGGPFKEVDYAITATGQPQIQDPRGQIAACWSAIGNDVILLRNFISQQGVQNRTRSLLQVSTAAKTSIISDLWKIFRMVVPVCMSEGTYGLVAASKILFAVLPEVALPIDNVQWKKVFRTIDYENIISLMADEIMAWEKQTGQLLDSCDPSPDATLPAIYNVMAMKARP